MPRKYHRPPDTTKRRKIRKTISPGDDTIVENGGTPEADENLEAPVTAVSVADPEPEAEDSPQLRGILRRAEARGAVPGASQRHVARDYSYVLGDIMRIGAIATFLIVSLVITAILRN